MKHYDIEKAKEFFAAKAAFTTGLQIDVIDQDVDASVHLAVITGASTGIGAIKACGA